MIAWGSVLTLLIVSNKRSRRFPSACNLDSSPAVHVPSGIYPLSFTRYAGFGDTAGLVGVLAASLQFVRIIRVHHRGGAINLDFGFGKLALNEFAAALRKIHCAVENRLTASPGVIA